MPANSNSKSDQGAGATSHLMKTTRRGRAFAKDTHDLFATLVVSLRLEPHRSLFKVYPNSFTTDEACQNLSSLKFSQSNRSPDPQDPSRIITTTTTTTFSMTRDMAKGICQHFLDAHLISNASEPKQSQFKNGGIFQITPKGLHVLERFITKNGISAEHLLKVFASQAICLKLLHLERRSSDDEILIGRGVVEIVFKRFAGRGPNLVNNNNNAGSGQGAGAGEKGDRRREDKEEGTVWMGKREEEDEPDRNLGVPIKRLSPSSNSNTSHSSSSSSSLEFHFLAPSAIEWLCDYTTIVAKDEAADMCAHFVRYGLIGIVEDGKKSSTTMMAAATTAGRGYDPAKIAWVRTVGAAGSTSEAEFRFGEKTWYRITPEGRRIAKWNESDDPVSSKPTHHSPNQSTEDIIHRPSEPLVNKNPTHNMASATDDRLIKRASLVDRLRLDYLDLGGHGHGNKVVVDEKIKDSHTSKLKQILEEPSIRSLFREFLRSNFCEENLSFWLDVQDFKRRFNTTSSAVASPVVQKGFLGRNTGHSAMERHQQDLIAMAFVIYNTYLAPASTCELNIDHNLREELVAYMSKIAADVNTREGREAMNQGTLDPAMVAKTLQASQLQTMVRLYERIQSYIFRLMATDSVPKFCKTEKYVEIMDLVFDVEPVSPDTNATAVPGTTNRKQIDDLGMKSPVRAYVTISQAANEKQAALLKSRGSSDSSKR